MTLLRSLAPPLGALFAASLVAAAPQSGTAFGPLIRPGLGGLPGPLVPEAVAAQDFDGDGLTDLFVVGTTASKRIAGVARGIAPDAYGPPIGVTSPAEGAIPTLGDIDGNGHVDVCLVTEGSSGRGLQVMLNSGVPGSNLSFGPAVSIRRAHPFDHGSPTRTATGTWTPLFWTRTAMWRSIGGPVEPWDSRPPRRPWQLGLTSRSSTWTATDVQSC